MTTENVYIIIALSVFLRISQKLFEGMRYFMTAFKKPFKSALAVLLALVITAAVPFTALAATDGTDDGALTLTEEELLNKKTEGDFEYIKINDDTAAQLVGYTGTDTKVSVPSKLGSVSVTSIGKSAFANNGTVEVIKLTSAVTEVCAGAFMNCTALKEVQNADSLTSIGASAFEGCTSLTEYKVPDSVTAVPERCFFGCTALAEVKPHKNLKNVAKDAFVDTAWENAAPEGALNLGRVLYSYKGDVTSLNVGEGIEIIEEAVFIGNTEIKTVTFGEDVEEIGAFAFQNCTGIETVVFGSAVSLIDAGAFKGCSSLKEIDLTECTVAAIGYEAFEGCSSLTGVKLSETLTDIEDRAFAGTAIEAIEFGKNVKNLGSNVFADVETLNEYSVVDNNKSFSSSEGVLYNKKGKALVAFPAAKTGSFTLPENVEEIKNGAFRCSDIETVAFPENTALKTVGAYAFENSKITAVTLPETVTTVNNSAFKNATELKEVKLGSAVTYIGASAFEGCSALSEIALPDTLRDIAANAFKNAGLESVNTGNGVVRIDTGAFYGNEKLTALTIGESVEKLGDEAFAYCTALSSVALPASLENLTASAFSGCTALKDISVSENNKAFKNIGSAVYSADSTSLVLVPVTSSASVAVAEGTVTILSGAFDLVPGVSAIAFSSTLQSIEGSALDGTAWFKSNAAGAVYAGKVLYKAVGNMAVLAIADGTVAVADNAVNNETVTAVIFPATLKAIGAESFKGSALTSVTLPASVASVGDEAFANISTLKSVTFAEGSELTALGNGAFENCTALEEFELPAGVTAVSTDLFAGDSALKSVTLGNAEEIGKYAFSGCSALSSLILPKTLKAVDPLSFLGCVSLETVDVEDGNELYKSADGAVIAADENGEWNKLVLYPQGKDGDYAVPEGITEIGDRAFYDCDGLTFVSFADGLKRIGDEAFFDCDAVRTVNIPESARNIGEYAFGSCNELREFIVNSNLTSYADNAFDGCFYFNYDAVTINVPDNSGSILGIVVGVLVIIALVWFLVYKKKEKKLEKERLEKLEKKNAVK